MKKMFSLMLVITSILCFTACSSDDEEKLPNIPNSKYIKVGESFDLGYECNWVSSNTFSVTVNSSGVIKGVRKGTAYVYSKDKDLECYVSVSPSYTLYNEPIIDLGVSKSSIKSKKGTPDSETSTAFTYNTNNTIAPIEMYLFDSGGQLKVSAVIVSTSYTDELIEHLSQRYKPETLDVENYRLSFIDAETQVVAQLYTTSYWVVFYGEYTSRRSVKNNTELFETMISELKSKDFDTSL